MKAFFVQDTLMAAGAEKSHFQIMSRFSAATTCAMVYFYPRHNLKEDFEKAGIPVYFLNLKGKYDWLKGIFRLYKLVRHEKPDLLVACLMRATLMARIVSLLTGVKLVGTIVNDTYGGEADENFAPANWKTELFRKFDRWGAGIHEHWIANAFCLVDSHVRRLNIPRKSITVVHRGRIIPQMEWQPLIDFQAEKIRFISYGRLLERKGFADLIQAFAVILRSRPEASLTIYGEGPDRERLDELISVLGIAHAVRLPGAIHKVEQKLYEADCFIFPSWYEGFSGALIEAMMTGIPVIASDIPMNHEAMTEGVHGRMFQCRKYQSLAAAMENLCTDYAAACKMGTVARTHAEKLFNIDRIASLYESTLLRVHNGNFVPAAMVTDQPPQIKIGLLLDNWFVRAWVIEMIAAIRREGIAEISLVVLNEGSHKKSSGGKWLYRLYRKLDRQLFPVKTDAFGIKDLRHYLPENLRVIKVTPHRKKFHDIFPQNSVAQIKAANPDVLIRIGFRILKGEILHAAKWGIWSLHHGDNHQYRGGPPCFWEVMENTPATGSILQILNEELDAGTVLYRSLSRTDPLSVNRNANKVFWKSAYFISRVLRQLYYNGPDYLRTAGPDSTGSVAKPAIRKPPGTGQLLKVLPAFIGRNFIRKRREFTRHENWSIYYWNARANMKPWSGPAVKIENPKGKYLADPFLFSLDGVTAMFVESFDRSTRKGSIHVLLQTPEGWTKPVSVLEEPYHLSYPFVFEDNGKIWMLPEQAESGKLILYCCVKFPFEWRRHAVLFENVSFYDPTILKQADRYWLFVNSQIHPAVSSFDELFLFSSGSLEGPWIPHPLNPVVSDVGAARPAGKLFFKDGSWYRPAQDSTLRYGHQTKIRKIVVWDEKNYSEETVEIIRPEWQQGLQGVHTVNALNDIYVADAFER